MKKIIFFVVILVLLATLSTVPASGQTGYTVFLPIVFDNTPLYDAITMNCGFQPNAPRHVLCQVWSGAEYDKMEGTIDFVWGDVYYKGFTLKEAVCNVDNSTIEHLWATESGLLFTHYHGDTRGLCYKLYKKR
jgi:hypothetical protein